MPPTGTKCLVLPRAQKFSPTSLVERAREWFISAAAPTLPSSSQLQAFVPNLSLQCLWAYWACCGPESWPMVGFLVVFRPWWPSRWHHGFRVARVVATSRRLVYESQKYGRLSLVSTRESESRLVTTQARLLPSRCSRATCMSRDSKTMERFDDVALELGPTSSFL